MTPTIWSKNSADRSTFAWLLAPHSIEEFAAGYYERAPLHISRNAPGFYDRYFSLAEMERVLYGCELHTADLQMFKDGTAARVEKYVREVPGPKHPIESNATDVVHADRASALFAGGCTLVIDKMHKYSPSVAMLCREIELCLRCHVNPNVYMTPPGNQGFAVHYDTHDAIVIQIHGSKHWRVYERALELPLEHQYWDKKLHPAGKVLLEMEMQPGDLLYIPRGCLHEGRANDELSLHVTIGLYPPVWAQIAFQALARAAEAEAALRAAADDLSADAIAPKLAAALTPQMLRDTLKHTIEGWMSERDNGLDGQLAQLSALSRLSENSIVAKRPSLLYKISETEHGTRLTFSGKTLTLPAAAAAIIRELDAVESMQVAALAGEANPIPVLKRLIQEGFAIQIAAEAGSSAVA